MAVVCKISNFILEMIAINFGTAICTSIKNRTGVTSTMNIESNIGVPEPITDWWRASHRCEQCKHVQ